MSNKFLFELGTEEIPASMIGPALKQMEDAFVALLEEHAITSDRIRLYSTPRRLTLIAEGLPERCPDRNEVLTGPPTSVAVDSDGAPTPAALGFARKMGVTFDDLNRIKTEKGEYLALKRSIIGDPLREILAKGMPSLISAISWPKNMYWRDSRFRFIRPLRWYVSLWNSEIVPFEFEGVVSGRKTRGHRMLGEKEFEIRSVSDYLPALEKNFVLADPLVRLERIQAGLKERKADLDLVPDEELLQTVVNLNEFPSVLKGHFDPEFLEIPDEVLVTVMRFHQKYFSLSASDGKLAPYFLTVVNTSGDPEGLIRKGHEKVLQARLEDAAFFWEADQKQGLLDRVESLKHVLFQERLGTYLEKTERVKRICAFLDPDKNLDIAAHLCKADLTTDMVREFPELQGIMGGLYARQEGHPEDVWRAIYDHYKPVSLDDNLPATKSGVLLSIADRLDTIVGCFGIDIIPTGSSDPFALRRQAQGLVALLHGNGLELELERLVKVAQENFESEKCQDLTREQVLQFLQQRMLFIFQKEGLPGDVLKAVFASGIRNVPEVYKRARALAEIKDEPGFEALAVAFKRTRNILEKFGDEDSKVEPELLVEEEEKKLLNAYEKMHPLVEQLISSGDHLSALKEMAAIRREIDLFFEKVMVMSEDERLRRNRLALLQAIAQVFLSVADISEVVKEGRRNGE